MRIAGLNATLRSAAQRGRRGKRERGMHLRLLEVTGVRVGTER